MLSSHQVAGLMRRLWPPDAARYRPLWAVLDGAQGDAIHGFLRRSYRDKACLIAGDLHPRLARAAPYLLRLEENDLLTRELLAHFWGSSWGVLVYCDRPLAELRRHLVSLLRVRSEEGKALIFRFYDPRVLRVYLPGCTPPELASFFGPLAGVVLESETAAEILQFAFARDRLTMARTAIAPG